MTLWEYRTVEIRTEHFLIGLEDRLNFFGSQGWELFSMSEIYLKYSEGDKNGVYRNCVFKRMKQEN